MNLSRVSKKPGNYCSLNKKPKNLGARRKQEETAEKGGRRPGFHQFSLKIIDVFQVLGFSN